MKLKIIRCFYYRLEFYHKMKLSAGIFITSIKSICYTLAQDQWSEERVTVIKSRNIQFLIILSVSSDAFRM